MSSPEASTRTAASAGPSTTNLDEMNPDQAADWIADQALLGLRRAAAEARAVEKSDPAPR